MDEKTVKMTDAEEIARALKELPEEERKKFFYMIEGARVVQPAREQQKTEPQAG